MPYLILLYFAIGLAVQCALFTVNPDWADLETWRHFLLWPRYVWPGLPDSPPAIGLPAIGMPTIALPTVHWLPVALIAMVLVPIPALYFVRRLRQHGQRRKTPLTQAVPVRHAPRRVEPWLSA